MRAKHTDMNLGDAVAEKGSGSGIYGGGYMIMRCCCGEGLRLRLRLAASAWGEFVVGSVVVVWVGLHQGWE